jgi:hypothetical protein
MTAIEKIDAQIAQLETKLEALRMVREMLNEDDPVRAPAPARMQMTTVPTPKKPPAQTKPRTEVGWAPKIVAVLEENGPMTMTAITQAIGSKRPGNVYNLVAKNTSLFRRCAHDSRLWELCPTATTTEPARPKSTPTTLPPSESA